MIIPVRVKLSSWWYVTLGKMKTKNIPNNNTRMPIIMPSKPNILINIVFYNNKYKEIIMVFARTKLVMEDNCFEEEPAVNLMSFSMPNVEKLYTKVYETLKAVFNVADSDIQETDYKWAKIKNGVKFKVRWWLHKDLDVFSYLFLRFDVSGEGNEKSGNARVQIKALLRSEYPQDTVWQRSIFYEMTRTFWHRLFYHKKREEYAEDCRHGIIVFQKKVREFVNKLNQSIEKTEKKVEME